MQHHARLEPREAPAVAPGKEPDPDGPTDFSTLTPHDVRVAFVGWVIRCKGLEGHKYAELGGRWQEASTAFNIYMSCGSRTREKYIAQKTRDPIFERKPFPSPVMAHKLNLTYNHSLFNINHTNQSEGGAPRIKFFRLKFNTEEAVHTGHRMELELPPAEYDVLRDPSETPIS